MLLCPFERFCLTEVCLPLFFSLRHLRRRNHHATDQVTFSNLRTCLVRTIMIGKVLIAGFCRTCLTDTYLCVFVCACVCVRASRVFLHPLVSTLLFPGYACAVIYQAELRPAGQENVCLERHSEHQRRISK